MKKFAAVFTVSAIIAAAFLVLPKIVLSSIPTARNITVRKIEHTDILELTGSIIKNVSSGETNVLTYVSEKDISSVKTGQEVLITGEAFPGCVYNGVVSYISEYASSKQSGSAVKTVVEVKINITNPDERLKTGYTAKASLQTSEPEIMTVVPYEAVNQDELGEYVFVLENNVPVRRYIVTGRELSEGLEIVGGISPYDTVITVEDESSEGKRVLIE